MDIMAERIRSGMLVVQENPGGLQENIIWNHYVIQDYAWM